MEAAPAMERARLERELVRHHEDAWGWALNCCLWDRESAGDVLQDAYLRVLDGRAQYRERSPFRTWLFGVVRMVSLEHRRRAGRQAERVRRLAANGDAGLLGVSDPGPHERLELAERARRLREALGGLTERQREVLHLVFYQGMTVAEAADVMEVRVGTARTHYERAKRALRTELSEPWMT